MSDSGRSLVGVVWAAPRAAQKQPGSGFDCLTELALLFHTSSQWPATGAYKTPASLGSHLNTFHFPAATSSLIPLDMHERLCYITFAFY